MVKHIGILACSAEGAALCYRTICLEGQKRLGTYMHPEVTMHTFPLGQYMEQLQIIGWNGVADMMQGAAVKLANAGAEFIICPDNTIHQALPMVLPRSPLPWLHIAEEVASEAKRNGHKKLAVLGTKYLMTGPVYPEKLSAAGIEYEMPNDALKETVNQIIFDELVNGIFREESRTTMVDIIKQLQNNGCDAVVLGCTEIPLLIEQRHSPLPILDSTRILARAALAYAVSQPATSAR
jgi:aspartate racemase